MSANLSDFQGDELQALLNVVVARIVGENNHRKDWLKSFSALGGYYENQPDKAKEMEHLALWRVQILNAIVEASQRETMQSN